MKAFRITVQLFFILSVLFGCINENIELDVPSVSISILNQGPFTIGDPVDVALTIISKRNSSITYPKEQKHFSPFTLRDYTAKRLRVKRGIYKTMVIYRLAIYKTGLFSLKPLSVTVDDRVLETQPLKVQILSVLPKDEERLKPKDIVPPYRPRVRSLFVVIVALFIIVIFGAGFFLYRIFNKIARRKKPMKRMEVEDMVDPYQQSIGELERIKKQFLKNIIGTEQVYTELSCILRYFIGRLLDIKAPQMTTGQLNKVFRKKRFSFLPSGRFISLLGRSDLVKFARESPGQKIVKQDIEESIGIVQEVNIKVSEEQGGGI